MASQTYIKSVNKAILHQREMMTSAASSKSKESTGVFSSNRNAVLKGKPS